MRQIISGDIAEGNSDLPGQGVGWWPMRRNANCEDENVNGSSDLTDFFPVWLDIKSALMICPATNGFAYRLRQADNALQFVYTDLSNTNAGDYLIKDVASCGPALNQNVRDADIIKITAFGVLLNPGFLSTIAANPTNGVLLMEAIRPSLALLILEVLSNDTVVAQAELPLCLSGVEDMFRHINLRADGAGEPSRINTPNLHDSVTGNHALAFVHGYNVDGKAARGLFSETFKRLWQTGFNGRFVGISWFGNPDAFLAPDYYRSSSQAFAIADEVADAIADLKQNVAPIVDVIAHSAGNIVVGSAIQNHGCTFRHYIALDAAVPLEAYGSDARVVPDANGYYRLTGVDAGMTSTASFDEGIFSGVTKEWKWDEYDARLHASEWCRLFPNDARGGLTWRNRFGSVNAGSPVVYNFYSSTEEVLRNYDEASLIHGSFMDWLKMFYNVTPAPGEFDLEAGEHFKDLYAWVKQEKLKGRKDTWLPSPGGLPGKWAGWGFAEDGPFIKEFLWTVNLYPKSPAEIQAVINRPDATAFWKSVETEPLFRNRPDALFGPHAKDYLSTDSSNIPGLRDNVHGCPFADWLLASAFPARTWAVGANVNSKWNTERNNFNMSSSDFMTDVSKWPRYCKIPNGSSDRPEWHHSDFKDIAYPHVYKLYEKWIGLTEE